MKSTAVRFLLPLAVLGLAFAGFLHYRAYTTTRRHLTQAMDQQAAIALEFNLAVREYVAETIRPILTSMIGKDDFIPEAMSTSFVSRSVFEKVHKKFPDVIVKFASDNPRNPVNQATPDELKMIEYFNANPQINQVTATISVDGRSYQAHFSAKRMEPSCLRCHARPEDAPAALVKRYGATASFHRPLGAVVAMDTVAVPSDQMNAALASETTTQTAITVTGLVFLLTGIWLVFRRLVSRRLATMAAHFRSIASQVDSSAITPLQITGDDEIANLAATFNTLARQLQATYASLEERVDQRTAELARTNEQLKCQVADRERAEEQLQQAKTAAEAAAQAKSEFLANMSHEVRTPMTAILGYTDVLLDSDGLAGSAPAKLEAAQTIKRNGEYLLSVLNDILDLSKIEAGRMTVERIACSPLAVVAEVASLMRVRAEASGLSLHVEYVGTIPAMIQTDPTRLRQILINLVGNAVKFTPRGEIRLIVRLRDAVNDVRLQFDVVDTGVGMSDEEVAELFRPFTQADTSTTRKFGGTGLGLTISKRLAEMLGGDIAVVETRPGAGTRFRATVAVGSLDGVTMIDNPALAAVIDDPTPDCAAIPGRAVLEGCRILVVEDGPDNQRLVSYVLEKAGALVAVVENGDAAIHAVLSEGGARGPFQVILMDMQMPVMDGYTATKRLRAAGYTGRIIALTAHAMTSDRARCLACGCDEYVSKPINRTVLLETIRRVLETGPGAQPPHRVPRDGSLFATNSAKRR